MNKRTLKRAIGVSDGKTVTIANECAIVEIQLQHMSTGSTYHVSGDASPRTFHDLGGALTYAVAQLALYMDGSPNR